MKDSSKDPYEDIITQLAETAYNTYWENEGHRMHLRAPFSKQSQRYKEIWVKVAKAVAEEVKYDI
jgi:hypothetical protein